MSARLSRRSVLSASVAASVAGPLLVGCTPAGPPRSRLARDARTTPAPTTPGARATPDPDVALLGEVVEGGRSLLLRYERVLDRHPELSDDLRPHLQAHRAHRRALDDAAPDSAPASPEPSGTPPDVATPRRTAAAVLDLRTAEQMAADTLLAQTQAARSGAFAGLLASMAASAAQRAQALGEVRA